MTHAVLVVSNLRQYYSATHTYSRENTYPTTSKLVLTYMDENVLEGLVGGSHK